jgi:plastocyanin
MHRTVTILAVAGALLGATTLAACGGGSSGSDSGAAAAATPAKSTAAAATVTPEKTANHAGSQHAARPVKASISGFAFTPRQLQVHVGQEITWTNQDSAPHTVTATSGAKFDSGTLAQGASYSWKATKAGTIEYVCAIHPSMTGTIVVE